MWHPKAHQRARNTGPHGLNNTATVRGNNTLDAAAAAPPAEPSLGTDGGELICIKYRSFACNFGVC